MDFFRLIQWRPQYPAGDSFAWVLALITLLIPVFVHAQCPPVTESAKLAPPRANTSAGQPEFFDEPQFTVAGITEIGRAHV
jgi:hypothetical protein